MDLNKEYNQLQILLKKSAECQMYSAERIVKIKLQEVAAIAHLFGYDFEFWQETGLWRKYQDVSNQTQDENKTLQKTEVVETFKTEKISVQAFQSNNAVCESCSKAFEKKRKTQRFCTKKCKNDFHNAKK
jgi:hypothetical protein